MSWARLRNEPGLINLNRFQKITWRSIEDAVVWFGFETEEQELLPLDSDELFRIIEMPKDVDQAVINRIDKALEEGMAAGFVDVEKIVKTATTSKKGRLG